MQTKGEYTPGRLRRIWSATWPALLIFAFLNGIYSWGYWRGHGQGALEMKCAIFGVVDRLNEDAPDHEKYALTKLGCRPSKAKGLPS